MKLGFVSIACEMGIKKVCSTSGLHAGGAQERLDYPA
jgi:hypothetical protein